MEYNSDHRIKFSRRSRKKRGLIDYFSNQPAELLQMQANYLGPDDIDSVMAVNRRLNQVLSDNHFWRGLYKRDFPDSFSGGPTWMDRYHIGGTPFVRFYNKFKKHRETFVDYIPLAKEHNWKRIQPIKVKSNNSLYALPRWNANHYYMYKLLYKEIADTLFKVKTSRHLLSFLTNRLIPGYMAISFGRNGQRNMFISTTEGIYEILYYDIAPIDMTNVYQTIVNSIMNQNNEEMPSIVIVKMGNFDKRKIDILLEELAELQDDMKKSPDSCIVS